MPLSDWSEKQFLALTAGIVGGVLVIAAGVLFYFYSSYSELEEKRKALDVEVKGLKKEADRLEEVKKILEDESATQQVLNARVPETANIDEFIAQINEQSRSAQVVVKSIGRADDNRGRRGAAPRYEPVTIKIECVGGYHQLGQFINRLEQRMERLVAVSSFQISAFKTGLEPGKKALTIKLEIQTYKYNSPQGAQAPQ